MSDATRNQYATAALKEQRSLLAGELAELEKQVRDKEEALAHVDAVLHMFAPELDPSDLPVRRTGPESPYTIPHATRRVLGILRRRGEPMHVTDVTEALMTEMGFGPDGLSAVATRTRYILRDLAKGRGPVVKTGWRTEAMWAVR